MHDLLTMEEKKPTQGEVPGGSTRPEELFTVFTGIILTAETERARKGSAAAANTKGYMVPPGRTLGNAQAVEELGRDNRRKPTT